MAATQVLTAWALRIVKAQLQSAWTNGGMVDLIMCGPFNKTVISGFTGNTTRTQDTSDGKLAAAIDVYESDFGIHTVKANRFSRDRDLHLLMSDMWAVSYLRPIKAVDLARTGEVVRDGDPLVYVRTLVGRGVAARAPVDGTVVEVLVRPGQVIRERGTVVVRLNPK